ncbi:MAG: nucleoside hydrolase [Eubacteriales bacterium]|nr:nucleoside hydrolase [Eubacteriales bacterium]
MIDNAWLAGQLKRPAGRVDVVLDTDTYNEIDDQYALAYLIKSEDKLNLQAIYAAPFSNKKCEDPGEGMEKSYEEIMRILTLMEREDLKKIVKEGSRNYLEDGVTPVPSKAAEDLVQRAMEHTEENPLYVIAIAAITNVVSAILMEPEIKKRMVVVWLGGQAHWWPENREFNLIQDITAARVLFGCGVPLVQLPCMGVVSEFRVSGPELEYHLRGKNKLCDYLVDVTVNEALRDGGNTTWSRIIWDVTAVAWLLDERFERDCLVHSPVPEYDNQYALNQTNHLIKYVYHIERDQLLGDLFEKLSK